MERILSATGNGAREHYATTRNSGNRNTRTKSENNRMHDKVSGTANNNRSPPRSTTTESGNRDIPDDVQVTINGGGSNNNNQYNIRRLPKGIPYEASGTTNSISDVREIVRIRTRAKVNDAKLV